MQHTIQVWLRTGQGRAAESGLNLVCGPLSKHRKVSWRIRNREIWHTRVLDALCTSRCALCVRERRRRPMAKAKLLTNDCMTHPTGVTSIRSIEVNDMSGLDWNSPSLAIWHLSLAYCWRHAVSKLFSLLLHAPFQFDSKSGDMATLTEFKTFHPRPVMFLEQPNPTICKNSVNGFLWRCTWIVISIRKSVEVFQHTSRLLRLCFYHSLRSKETDIQLLFIVYIQGGHIVHIVLCPPNNLLDCQVASARTQVLITQ